MEKTSRFITIFLAIVSAFSSFITIWDKIGTWGFLEEYNFWKVEYLYWILGVSIPIFVVRGCYNYLKSRGYNQIPVSLLKSLRRFNPIISCKIFKEIHNLQHLIQEHISLVTEKLAHENQPLDIDKRRLASDFLLQCQKIVQLLVGSSLTVHFKLIENPNQSKKQDDNEISEKFVFHTYERIVGSQEFKERKENKIWCRSKDKLFVLKKWQDNLIYSIAENKETIPDNLYFNSAYCYVLGKNSHYWFSNNIPHDTKKGKYLNTNLDANKFYKSLAVFLIAPPTIDGSAVNSEIPMGLFIVDCKKTNVFDVPICEEVFGYLSHRAFDYLSYIL